MIEMLARKSDHYGLRALFVMFFCLAMQAVSYGDDVVAETRDLLRRYDEADEKTDAILYRELLAIEDERAFHLSSL
jgi:hypothetical protein